ncbi:arylsulfatase A-like enzyme [Haloferula luteola]|uniref:Arylsulfatase A-like enzyme n=1 Tax=Haloferula luteola TaxID=595692 RepID=A0A840V9C1_9BACT|nr:sulfatase [Haloferula luteola]MBB5352184.1 arylsulfatase A-like enzyme [Haloferula luteola]
MENENCRERVSDRRAGWAVALGIGLFLVIQYGIALFRLSSNTGSMDSKFSKLAVSEYLSFLIAQNLRVGVAYLLLGVAAWLLLFPLMRRFARGRAPLVKTAALTLVAVWAIHGYFMFRLIWSRPYFMGEGHFGGGYERWLQLPPESWRPVIHGLVFVALPWVGVVLAAISWARRVAWVRRWGVGLILVAAVGSGVMHLGRAWRVSAAPMAGGNRAPNVLIIGSDSLRGDKLGFAGYRPQRSDGLAAQGVSPHIDQWASDAYQFLQCRTPMGSTLESNISTMTSSYPHTHGIRQMFPPREEVEAMQQSTIPVAEVLEARGYQTFAIGDWCAGFFDVAPLGFDDIRVSSFDNFRIYMTQAVMMAHFVVPLYFDNELGYQLFPQIQSFASFVTPEVVTGRVEKLLRQQSASDRPFFMNVFFSCNHLPYRSAEPYCSMFADPNYEGPNKSGVDFDIDEFIGGTDLEQKWKALPEKEARQIRALYDGCTRQFDDCFGRILKALAENGLENDTIVVLSADHGDDLYEPKVTLGHGLTFAGGDQGFHIPLVIRVPGTSGGRFTEQVRTLDIAPTLADFAGAEKPERWEGQSLMPWIRGTGTPQDRPYFGETQFPFIQFHVAGIERPLLPPMDELTTIDPSFNHQFVMKAEYRQPVVDAKQRCLRTGQWKLVMTPTRSGGRHYQLFHTAEDPDAMVDLAAQRPEVLAPMKAAMDRWMDAHEETAVDEIFPAGEPN